MQSVISCLLAIKRIMCERKVIPKNYQTTIKKNSSTRNLLLLVDEKSAPVNKRKPSCFKPTTTITNYIPAFNHTANKKLSTATTTTNTDIVGWPKKLNNHYRRVEPMEKKKYFHTERVKKTVAEGGYVKSQVQMITTSNNNNNNQITGTTSPLESVTRRLSSDIAVQKKEEKLIVKKQIETKPLKQKLPPIPKPSKSTPLAMATKSSPSTAVSVITATKKKVSSDYKKSSTVYSNMEANRKTSLKKMGSCAIPVTNDDGTSALYVSITIK